MEEHEWENQDASYPDNEGVQLPTWYIMLRPSHLMNEEREVGSYVRGLPECLSAPCGIYWMPISDGGRLA